MLNKHSANRLISYLNLRFINSEHKFFYHTFDNFCDGISGSVVLSQNTDLEQYLNANSETSYIRPFYIYYKHLDSNLLMYDYIEKHTGKKKDEITEYIQNNIKSYNIENTINRMYLLQIFHFIAHTIALQPVCHTINNISYRKHRSNVQLFGLFDKVKESGHDIVQIVSDPDLKQTYLSGVDIYYSELPFLFQIIEYVKGLDNNNLKPMLSVPDFEIMFPYGKLYPASLRSVSVLVRYCLAYELVTKYEIHGRSDNMIQPKSDVLTGISDVIEV